MRLVVVVALLALCTSYTLAVDVSKFRKCDQSGFCKRNRNIQNPPIYNVVPGSLQSSSSRITADLKSSKDDVILAMELISYENSITRLRIKEKNPYKARYEISDVLMNIKESPFKSVANQGGLTVVDFGTNKTQLKLNPEGFKLDFFVDGLLAISANNRGMMNFEYLREKPIPPAQVVVEQPASPDAPQQDEGPADPHDESGVEAHHKVPDPEIVAVGQPPRDEPVDAWEESFGSHTDTKPRGPEAVAMDFSFPGSKHVYGIPEHASSHALKNTKDDDPYRLYNLDVFEYELDKTMALYGSVPFMISHDAGKTVGVFWFNPSETFIDIADATETVCQGLLCSVLDKGRPRKDTHWISESGVLDVFFLMGPTPTEVYKQYAYLTGTGAMPQQFAIAYHQCRWNYKDEPDVAMVDSQFDVHNIPYDVLWLDIEHTDGKRYFTWDSGAFPTPERMQNAIADKGRKMVVIIDPHIKRDTNYAIHTDAQAKNLYVKDRHNNEYDGWCWPGSSSYLDFTNPLVRDWWAEKMSFSNYKGSTPALYVWNDMNEPSVFNGPEVSMDKDAIHMNGWEHRALHNVYGFYMHMATSNALTSRHPQKNDRPFVLSRAFYAGSQRYGAIWTGDNAGQWSHLAASVPMLLSLNVAGITFSGADVGGFFGNPDAELLTRWYQAGAFYPFFRGHAHLDAKRREPYSFGEPYTTVIRDAIRVRYQLLPYWYTLFRINNETGQPILRPLWTEFPKEHEVFDIEDQFMVGGEIIVKPVATSNQATTTVYLPGASSVWYDYFSHQRLKGYQTVTVSTPLERIPVFIRGGSILPTKERARRSSTQMATDPYTLLIALDNEGSAAGQLYSDDGHTFDFLKGAYEQVTYKFSNHKLETKVVHSACQNCPHPKIERIVIIGVPSKPKAVTLEVAGTKTSLEFEFLPGQWKVVVRKPEVASNAAFTMYIEN